MASTARHQYRVLYFINGPAPSSEERDDILQYGPHAVFRNAQYAGSEGAPEACIAVAGEVPALYARHFPLAVTYDAWRNGELPAPPSFDEIDAEGLGEGVDGEEGVSLLPPAPADPFAPPASPGPRRSKRQAAEWAKNA